MDAEELTMTLTPEAEELVDELAVEIATAPEAELDRFIRFVLSTYLDLCRAEWPEMSQDQLEASTMKLAVAIADRLKKMS